MEVVAPPVGAMVHPTGMYLSFRTSLAATCYIPLVACVVSEAGAWWASAWWAIVSEFKDSPIG